MKVKFKNSKIHNKGGFAARDIKKGEKIIEYIGEKITKEESDKRADIQMEEAMGSVTTGAVYIFELNDDFDIDGNVPYNCARLINHSCDPNSETEIIDDHIWIIAIKDIKQGEEITYNYGYDIEDYENHPCHCGKEKCIGYIAAEEHWPKLKKIIKQAC